MIKKIINILLLFLIVIPVIAQPKFTDSKLAYEYYRNKEYDKAIIIYKNLYDNSSNPRNYFTLYLNCLIQLKEYENAEKLIKSEKRKRPKELTLLVELGNIYKLQGFNEKSAKQFEQAIKKLNEDKNQVIRLANSFRGKREYRYAEQTIIKGRKILRNEKLFSNELANIYLMERKIDLMVKEYLTLLSNDPSNLKNVKNRLQSSMYIDVNDEIYNIIQSSVMLSIQKNPNITVYNSLLIWLYIQKKEFDKAFYQAKALDKRLEGDGDRLMEIAGLAYSNELFDISIEILDYVITKGPESNNYINAKFQKLNVINSNLLLKKKYSYIDIESIEKQYLIVMDEFGKDANSAVIIKDLAHIQAFYLNKTDSAISNLLLILDMARVKRNTIDLAKLELADIYLFTGKIWDAALLYAQVEKDNEASPIGHEAKLRKAKLAYYSGDFLWAQAQLDVLKASTSKLIANDAFDLAMLINENTAMDTSTTAMKMFAKAELLIYRNRTSDALLVLDSITDNFPGHSLADNILFRKGEIMMMNKEYFKASEYFKLVCDNFGFGLLGDNALFMLAGIYDDFLLDKKTAMDMYKRLLDDYPGSIYVVESRKRYRSLRGDSTEVEPETHIETNP